MTTPVIHVLCPDHNKVSGGVRMLYRHVDVLNRAGFNATILHQIPGFRCAWFGNSTRVTYLPEVRLSRDDMLVVPEIFGPNMLALGAVPNIGRDVRKVIFNQGCYLTFLGETTESVLRPDFTTAYSKCKRGEYVAAMVVSEDSRHYLTYAFPGLPVYRIHNAINADVFRLGEAKKPQICFMPRRHPEDAVQVLGMLNARGVLRDFSVVAIDKMSEVEVSNVMRESMIFLSFGYPEGFSLPPAEAMACGCVVVGYHGMGGAEYFKPDFSFPIAINDIVGYAQTVEALLVQWKRDPTPLVEMGQRASSYIRATYSSDRQRADIVAIWSELLNTPRGNA